ncbi:hypothetical protein H9L25_00495 [Terrisporobacter mayombei]|nr:hypothetical protein [Terrisporobacter mayombei]
MASKNIMIKKKVKTRPLYSLDKNFTQIANTMFKYIPNGNTFKIYVYLCYRYNRNYQYANVSINEIAEGTRLGMSTVQRSLEWLENNKIILKYRSNDYETNKYYIKYIDCDHEINNDKCDKVVDKQISEEILEFDEYEFSHTRREGVFINKLERSIGKIGVKQYPVLGYRIDYYIPDLNIAIEYDENDHKYYTYEQHEGRQKEIEEKLGCRFIRVSDRNSDEYNIDYVMNHLRE